MSPIRRLALLVSLLALSAACASSSPNDRVASSGSTDDLYVMFANNSNYQANVYTISSGGTRTRVGTIFAMRSERLRLPATVLGGQRTVQFEARMLGKDDAPRSGPVTFARGDSLEVSLSSDGTLLSVLPLRGRP